MDPASNPVLTLTQASAFWQTPYADPAGCEAVGLWEELLEPLFWNGIRERAQTFAGGQERVKLLFGEYQKLLNLMGLVEAVVTKGKNKAKS